MKNHYQEIKQAINEVKKMKKKGELEHSIIKLKEISKKYPEDLTILRSLGSILIENNVPKEAYIYLKKAIELSIDDPYSWKAMGDYYKYQEMWQEALTAFGKSIELGNTEIEIYINLLEIQSTIPNTKAVIALSKKISDMAPNNIDILWKCAKILKDNRYETMALDIYEDLIDRFVDSMSIEAISEWLDLITNFGKLEQDLRNRIKKLSLSHPNNAMLKYLYAQSLISKLDIESASKLLEESYKLDPNNIIMLHKIRFAYRSIANDDKSKEYIDKILQLDPYDKESIFVLSKEHKFKYGDELFSKINYIQTDIYNETEDIQIKIHSTLGKAYDDVDDLKIAFEHYYYAGAIHSKGRDKSDYENLKSIISKLKQNITKDFLINNIYKGCPTKKPIFIVGMPRSGTSLLEQVLTSFDNIYGAGELKYFSDILNGIDIDELKLNTGRINNLLDYNTLSYQDRGELYLKLTERLAPPNSKYIIDKMPFNFIYVGLIHLLLPDATIIHSRRHPIETCLSAYRIIFADGLYWSDDLRSIGKYYRLYHEVMHYWSEILPKGKILDVKYEDIVSDLATQSKKITDHIGIEWDNKCLTFHQNQRAVRTASISQVRKPIYTSSANNRWKKYEPFLEPLVNEIYDLVKEYEEELGSQ